MSACLSADELADLVGCKRNQRTKMASWLTACHWRFEVDMNGMPKVARAHHDRIMGIIDGPAEAKLTDEPNRATFAGMPKRSRTGAITKDHE